MIEGGDIEQLPDPCLHRQALLHDDVDGLGAVDAVLIGGAAVLDDHNGGLEPMGHTLVEKLLVLVELHHIALNL